MDRDLLKTLFGEFLTKKKNYLAKFTHEARVIWEENAEEMFWMKFARFYGVETTKKKVVFIDDEMEYWKHPTIVGYSDPKLVDHYLNIKISNKGNFVYMDRKGELASSVDYPRLKELNILKIVSNNAKSYVTVKMDELMAATFKKKKVKV